MKILVLITVFNLFVFNGMFGQDHAKYDESVK